MLGLTVYGTLAQGFSNFAVNMGVEGLVTLSAVAVIGPLVQRSREGGSHIYPRLNHSRFVREVAGARNLVQILTTFTPLLEGRNTEPFLESLRILVARHVQVDMLILHPDSLAVQQRQLELSGVGSNVAHGIHANIIAIERFIHSIPAAERKSLSVRLYNAGASIVMHRWDNQCLISFLPPNGFAEEDRHIEFDMSKAEREFFEGRFRDLWTDPKTISLADFLTIQLTILEERGNTWESPIDGRYARVDGALFVASEQIIAAQALYREQALRVRNGSMVYDVLIVDPNDSSARQEVADAFDRKYGATPHALVKLLPLPDE
jgi:hypothetical protein